MIEGDDKKRAEKCLQKIKNVLDQYDCVIVPVVIIEGTRIQSAMDVKAKPRQVPPSPTRN